MNNVYTFPDINSYIMQKIPGDRCLTVGERIFDQYDSPQYPLVQKSGCQGSDFMFTFHSRRLQHTKTGILDTHNLSICLIICLEISRQCIKSHHTLCILWFNYPSQHMSVITSRYRNNVQTSLYRHHVFTGIFFWQSLLYFQHFIIRVLLHLT